MKIEIREAQKKDLKQINAIAKQVHDLHVHLRPDIYLANDVIISEELFSYLLSEGVVFVTEADNSIVCYAVCFIKEVNIQILVKNKILFIDAIGSNENYRKRGLGTLMMQHIIEYAKQTNCNKIELQVSASNKEAIDFYQHLGMKEKFKVLEKEI